jgi:hypothetical protein
MLKMAERIENSPPEVFDDTTTELMKALINDPMILSIANDPRDGVAVPSSTS